MFEMEGKSSPRKLVTPEILVRLAEFGNPFNQLKSSDALVKTVLLPHEITEYFSLSDLSLVR